MKHFFRSLLAVPLPFISSAAASRTCISSASTSTPQFYLQVTNGTHAGRLLTTTKIIPSSSTAPVYYTEHPTNATIWTFYDYGSSGGPFAYHRTLKISSPDPGAYDVVLNSSSDTSAIYVIDGFNLFNNEYPVPINLTGWDGGAVTGDVVLSDPLVGYTQWNGCGKGFGVSIHADGGCLEALQFVRVGTCG